MLVKYEFLKIMRKKSTIIVMAVSLVLTGFLFGLPIMQYQIYNQDGVMKGAEGIAYEKGQYADLSVSLSEEYVAETIREVQELFENPDNIGYDGNEQFLIGDAYWNGVAPREKLLNLIANTYSNPNEIWGYNNLANLDIKDGTSFYQTRKGKIQTLLDNPSRTLSNEQKEYWGNMADKVDTPLQYGYYGGWEVMISSFELLMFALLAICIVVAPVFSGEYQAGTDAVILSAQYGKTKLTTASIHIFTGSSYQHWHYLLSASCNDWADAPFVCKNEKPLSCADYSCPHTVHSYFIPIWRSGFGCAYCKGNSVCYFNSNSAAVSEIRIQETSGCVR